ncbi:ABC transporter ATP-binding protein, partial [Eubacterium aggregans]|uniref:ABC transporter ATP-binding protein n=1 Tax=Eubacterium aggregans TaxID=81409 RepID=UPI0023F55EBA
KQGELVCLLGPSGCGKSTLLNIVAGFIKAEEGSVRIEGEVVTAPAINRLVIFQDYGLLPWRTVGQNVALGLEVKKVTRAEQNIMITKYLKMVGLEDARDKFPHQLSGGMQQRAAIARALAVQPEILLMDEPFGALDAITRMKLQEDILTLCRETGTTILFVTHDIEEAVYLADRIVILSANPGRIHAVLDVEMPHLRERTSDDFVLMRDRVFKAINLKHEHPLEYYL